MSPLCYLLHRCLHGTLRLAALLALTSALSAGAEELTAHPRLWITPEDLPRLRQWANDDNPVFREGLRRLADAAQQRMDNGDLLAGDNGGSTWSEYASEDYAALFALMALIDPVESARGEWAERGRSMLFHVIDRVDACQRAQPPSRNGDFCQLSFPVSDRSRWSGHGFPLAADWLQAALDRNGQPVLSAADKARLRRVFLIWSRLNMEAYPNPYNNPPQFSLPVGTVGEPLLRLDTDLRHHRLRFSGNNYFAGHMRNMTMRALAIDAADDVPDADTPATYLRYNGNGEVIEVPLAAGAGALRGLLPDVLGGWLYVQDYLLRNDSRGGLPQEGMEYAPTSIGIPTHLLLSLDSAGFNSIAHQQQWGIGVAGLATNPFYGKVALGMLHSLSPRPVSTGFGEVYQPAWYGDGEQYYQGDPVDILAPLGLYAARNGDHAAADLIRWMLRHVPPDGSPGLLDRARSDGNPGDLVSSILYFLLFDPSRTASAENAPDPRPALATSFWSEGMGRLLSRTDWSADASLFAFRLSYNVVDHQHGDGGMFDLYRRGEWLTKGTLGYGNDGGATDYKNSLTIENVIPADANPADFLENRLLRGAQMPQGRSFDDPQVLRRSESAQHSFVQGDLTNLYNAYYPPGDPTPEADRARDVQQVVRDIVWVKPDAVFVYDRLRSGSAGRRKRFWLNLPDRLPSLPSVSDRSAWGHTPGGQQLRVDSLLPEAVALDIVVDDTIMPASVNGYALGDLDPFVQERAGGEKFATRLRIEALGAPQETRFLTVLQGADGGSSPAAAQRLSAGASTRCPSAPGYDGAALGDLVLWFPQQLGNAADCLDLAAPVAITRSWVSGLQPNHGYQLDLVEAGTTRRWQLTAGGPWQSDAAGLLKLSLDPPPAASAQLQWSSERVDFPSLHVGQSSQSSIELHNLGNASSVALSCQWQDSNAFSIVGGDCLSTSVAAGGNCSLQIRFQPTLAGLHRGQLTCAGVTAALEAVGLAEASAQQIFQSGFESSEASR